MTHALVSGGLGFIGQHLVRRLVAEGASVVIYDDNSSSRPAAEFSESVKIVYAPAEHAAFDAYTHIVHLGSPTGHAAYERMPVETLRAGAHSTIRLLDIARKTGARFVLASSSEVYGQPAVHPQHEGYNGNVNPVGARSAFDEAKRFAEAATAAYQGLGVSAGILRIFNTYGPGMAVEDGRVTPTFFSQALRGEPITVAGSGQQTRSFCYVDDLVEAILLQMRGHWQEPMNVGNPHEISILDLAQKIKVICRSDSPITHIDLPEDDPVIRRPDINRITKATGWTPTVSLMQGLERCADYYHRHLLQAAH